MHLDPELKIGLVTQDKVFNILQWPINPWFLVKKNSKRIAFAWLFYLTHILAYAPGNNWLGEALFLDRRHVNTECLQI